MLRAPAGANKAATVSIFATGLSQPFGIAFYPPGPNPEWVYVANTDSVVRFPYRNGDLKARGAAETVIPKLTQTRSDHWTRDILFSPDGQAHVHLGGFRLERRRGHAEKDPRRGARLAGRPCAGRGLGRRGGARRTCWSAIPTARACMSSPRASGTASGWPSVRGPTTSGARPTSATFRATTCPPTT